MTQLVLVSSFSFSRSHERYVCEIRKKRFWKSERRIGRHSAELEIFVRNVVDPQRRNKGCCYGINSSLDLLFARLQDPVSDLFDVVLFSLSFWNNLIPQKTQIVLTFLIIIIAIIIRCCCCCHLSYSSRSGRSAAGFQPSSSLLPVSSLLQCGKEKKEFQRKNAFFFFWRFFKMRLLFREEQRQKNEPIFWRTKSCSVLGAATKMQKEEIQYTHDARTRENIH